MIHEYPIVQTQIRLRKHDLRMRIYVFTDCFEVMSYLELAWDYPNHEFWFGEFLWYIERWCLGDLVLKSTQPRWVFYSLRKCTFMYLIDLQMIYDFITEPTICWQYVLDVLSNFTYVEIYQLCLWNDAWMKSVIWIMIWNVWLTAVVGI
jgi:hypothetical protein